MASSRTIARGAAMAAALLLGTGAAAAQHHHHHHGGDDGDEAKEPAADHGPRIHGHAGLTVEGGRVEAFAGDRDYQGASLMVGARRDRVELMLHVPLYRIELGAATYYGLGDIHAMARYVVVSRGAVEAGVSAGVMPPFGDDEHGLGMGHWMIMAGGFARAARGRLAGELTVGYGGAPAGGGHAEHGVPAWPPVNPMNAHQLESTAQLDVTLGAGVGLAANLAAAAPLTDDGDFLALAGGGLTYQRGRYTFGAGARHGLAGHTAGLVLTANVMAGF